MRKVSLVLLVAAMVIFIFGKNYCMALDVKFDYSPSKDVQQNLLSTVNLHSGYSVLAYGVEKVFDQNKAWQRGAEIIVESQLAIGLSILGHEGGHDYYADKNGVVNRSVSWSFYSGSVSYDSSYSNLTFGQKSRLNAAGIIWNNRAAAETLADSIGEQVVISEALWYSANKINLPGYIGKASAPDQSESYGLSKNDIESWIRNVAGNDFGKMESLYSDLKVGAIWQGLSLIAPAGASPYYLFTGNIIQVPKLWFDTETELTTAGVMYALTGFLKHQGVTYNLRAGYGKNRIEEKTMSQIEAEIKNIPLPIWNLKAKVKAGYADTLSASRSIGFGLEKSFGQVAVGADVNRYDGYHRSNPKASEGLTEISTHLKFRF